VPELRAGGAADHEAATDDVRWPPLGQPRPHLEGPHRDQPRGLGPRHRHRWEEQPAARPAVAALGEPGTGHAGRHRPRAGGCRGWCLVAAGHLDVHPRGADAHRLQHAGPVVPRAAARGGRGSGAVPRDLPALGPGGQCVRVLAHPGLHTHRRGVRRLRAELPRSLRPRRPGRRAGAGLSRLQEHPAGARHRGRAPRPRRADRVRAHGRAARGGRAAGSRPRDREPGQPDRDHAAAGRARRSPSARGRRAGATSTVTARMWPASSARSTTTVAS